MTARQVIELTEFKPQSISEGLITSEIAEHIWREFGSQVHIEFPTPRTDHRYVLTNMGWAGYLPITSSFGILLKPKVPLSNVFTMMAYTYDLDQILFLENLVHFTTVQDAYEHLALLLARRIMKRAKQGLFRSYEQVRKTLPYIRGRIDMRELLQEPWQSQIPCRYRTHTTDIEDNFILAWAVERILSSGVCRDQSLMEIRQVHRLLRSRVNVVPFRNLQIAGRTYNRLNADYKPMHALCRFFLENTGPAHQIGDREMIPFVVNMAQLFESFVSSWLRDHLPAHYELTSQVVRRLDVTGRVSFRIDLVIKDRSTKRTICVIDTKYKVPDSIMASDVAQVIAYAAVESTDKAFLIYPQEIESPIEVRTKQVRAKTLGFSLYGNLQANGKAMLESLLAPSF